MLNSGEDSVVAALDEVRRLRKQAGQSRPPVHVATYGLRDAGPGGNLRDELRAPTPMDVVRGPFHDFAGGQQIWPPELPSPPITQRSGGPGILTFLLLTAAAAAAALGYGYVTLQKRAELATAQHGAALARLEAKLGDAVEARARAERQAAEGSARLSERVAACEAELAKRPAVAPNPSAAPAEPVSTPKAVRHERPTPHRRSSAPPAAAKAKPAAAVAPSAKVPPRIAPKRMVSDDPLAGLRGAR